MGSNNLLAYLSGPMTGLPNYGYDAFNLAAEVLRRQGIHVINPAETAGGTTKLPREVFMRIDVGYVQAADCVIVLPGWQHSKGAKLECILAASLGKSIFTYDPVMGLGHRVDMGDWNVTYREIALRPTQVGAEDSPSRATALVPVPDPDDPKVTRLVPLDIDPVDA